MKSKCCNNFFLFVFLITSFSVTPQSVKIDSLIKVLDTQKNDTNKVKTLNLLCGQYKANSELDKVIEYGEQSLELSKKLKYFRGEANALTKIGSAYEIKGDLPQALKYYINALKQYEQVLNQKTKTIQDVGWAKEGMAISYGNIGNVYALQGNLKEALVNQFLDLKIAQEIDNKKLIGNAYNNIGIIYYKQNNIPEALKNFSLALEMKKKIGNKSGMASSFSNIGAIYLQYANSFPINKKEHKSYKDSAKNNFNEAIKIYNDLNIAEGLIAGYINIAQIEREQNQTKAKVLLEKALKLSLAIGYKEATKICYKSLSSVDSVQGNYKSSFLNFKNYILYLDSLTNEENTKQMVQTQMQYEFDKKEATTKAEQEKKDVISLAEKKKQQVFILLISIVLLLVGIFAVFIFRSLKTTQKKKKIIQEQKYIVEHQKHLVEEKQKEIIDSINYAKRIQLSILPNDKYIERNLNKQER